MTHLESVKSLIMQAEVYRNQGLLEESLDTYREALIFLTQDQALSKNEDLISAVQEKIQMVESELAELELDEETPNLPPEIQDLISKLFSYSKNQDIAAIEGAVALAEFGQYEKSIEEFERLVNDGMRLKMDMTVEGLSLQFSTLITHLRDSYKYIRDQSNQLCRYARELSRSYKTIKKEQALRDTLSRYVGQSLVEKIVRSKDNAPFVTERKEVTILFADIRSFTSLTEAIEAEEIVAMLNQYFSAMVEIVFEHNGVLDKFVGDELMAVFGLLDSTVPQPCDDAVRAALEMQTETARLMKLRRLQGKKTFQIGIGINTGNAVIGSVGSKNRMDYTVIGDCVNVAARLQQVAQGGEIIIGEQTQQNLQGDFLIRKKGKLKLKNRAEPFLCYRVMQKSDS